MGEEHNLTKDESTDFLEASALADGVRLTTIHNYRFFEFMNENGDWLPAEYAIEWYTRRSRP